MSKQENNKMEAWLKAYRQQRRDQWNEDPLELDEPTRAMLMAEARRQKPAASTALEATSVSEPRLGWLRWALGGMTAAIVALGVWSLSQFQSDSDSMALANTDSPEANTQIKADTINVSLDDLSRNEAIAEAESSPGVMGGMSRGTAPTAPKGAAVGSPGSSGTVQALPQTAPHPVKVRHLPTRQNLKLANGNYYNGSREMQLNFAQQSRARSGPGTSTMRMSKEKELPKPVLVNFELKRDGNTVRVIDGDGSVYIGAVINEEALTEAEELEAMALTQQDEPGEFSEGGGEGASFAESGGAAPGGLAVNKPVKPVMAVSKLRRGSQAFFRVQGTSKTLKRLVILEATLDNSVHGAAALAGKVGKAEKNIAANAPANTPAVVSRPKSPTRLGGNLDLAPAIAAVSGSPALPGSGPNNLAENDPKNSSRNLGAIRAIARMRVLGNARIGKENYPVDAYLDTKAAGKVPADVKKK